MPCDLVLWVRIPAPASNSGSISSFQPRSVQAPRPARSTLFSCGFLLPPLSITIGRSTPSPVLLHDLGCPASSLDLHPVSLVLCWTPCSHNAPVMISSIGPPAPLIPHRVSSPLIQSSAGSPCPRSDPGLLYWLPRLPAPILCSITGSSGSCFKHLALQHFSPQLTHSPISPPLFI